MATTFNAYLIQCVTNLHVGSGDANYGIIDKMVQRDPVTENPTIHASSLKGALRQHFENHELLKTKVDIIFGTDGKDGSESESGTHRFLNADLIALPVRCTCNQFALSFDNELTKIINAKSKNIIGKEIFSLTVSETTDNLYGVNDNNSYAEDYQLVGQNFQSPFSFKQEIISKQFATFKLEHFKTITKNLPTIARNRVGESKNLWYEEVVPHQTIFLTFIGASDHIDEFDSALTTDLIQIGANASVGYGLCKFYKIDFNN